MIFLTMWEVLFVEIAGKTGSSPINMNNAGFVYQVNPALFMSVLHQTVSREGYLHQTVYDYVNQLADPYVSPSFIVSKTCKTP